MFVEWMWLVRGNDETAIVVLEQLPFSNEIFIKTIETMSTPDLNQAIGRVQFLDSYFNFKKVVVDETGLGAGVTDALKQRMLGRVEGVWYTQKSKAEIFTNLKLLMSKDKGKLWIPDWEENTDSRVRKLLYQLLSIKQEYKEGQINPKISHEAREHDDIVNALALSCSYFKVVKQRKGYPLGGGRGK